MTSTPPAAPPAAPSDSPAAPVVAAPGVAAPGVAAPQAPPEVSFGEAWKAKKDAPLHVRAKKWWWFGLISIAGSFGLHVLGLGIIGGPAGIWFAHVAWKGAKPFQALAKGDPTVHETIRKHIRQGYVMAIVGGILAALIILDVLATGMSGGVGPSSGCAFDGSGSSVCWRD